MIITLIIPLSLNKKKSYMNFRHTKLISIESLAPPLISELGEVLLILIILEVNVRSELREKCK